MALRSRAAARKNQRLAAVMAGLVMLGVSVALVLWALQDSVDHFYSPTDIAEKGLGPGTRISLGGLVAEGSVSRGADGATVLFAITDMENTVEVSYLGILPDLFREGQGVVTRGKLNQEGKFVAEEVLAKHDENYMPPEVADALKRTGKWRHAEDGAE